jgi:hypothetical protein
MANLNITRASPYSLFDADLPLLAVDAAAEIDSIIAEDGGLIDQATSALQYTNELLDRLVSISSNQNEINVDSIMYEQSFLPTLGQEREMFQQPTTLKERLTELMSHHANLAEKDTALFFSGLREFFLEVSKFSSSSRRKLRIGSNPYPNATM